MIGWEINECAPASCRIGIWTFWCTLQKTWSLWQCASEMKKALSTVQEHNGELTWQFTLCIGKHVVVVCHMQWLLRQDQQCAGPSLIGATGVSESQIASYDVCTGQYGCAIIVTLSSLIGEVLCNDSPRRLVWIRVVTDHLKAPS